MLLQCSSDTATSPTVAVGEVHLLLVCLVAGFAYVGCQGMAENRHSCHEVITQVLCRDSCPRVINNHLPGSLRLESICH